MSNYEPLIPGSNDRRYPEIVHTPALINPSNLGAVGASIAAQYSPGPDGGEGGAGFARYIHALRRRWLISLVIALPLSAVATYVTWSLQPQLYVTSRLLDLAPTDTRLAFNTMDQDRGGAAPFELFKKTQRLMILQRSLFMRALDSAKHPDVAKLPALKTELDPVDWLEQHLSVTFPDDAQLMRVSLTSGDPTGLHETLNALIDEYYSSVVDAERIRKDARISNLEAAYNAAKEELIGKRQRLKAIAGEIGSAEKGALSEVQKNTLAHYAAFVQRMAKINFDKIEAKNMLEHREAAFSEQDPKELVSENDLVAAMGMDLVVRQYEHERRQILSDIEAVKRSLKPERAGEKLKELGTRLEANGDQLAKRKDEVRDQLVERAKLTLEGELNGLRRQVALLESEHRQLSIEANKLQAEAKRTGQGSIDAEMLSIDISATQEIANNLRLEWERTRVEWQPKNPEKNLGAEAPNPVTRIKPLAPAAVARPVDPKTKLVTTIGAGGLSFLLPFLLFVVLDASKNRISTGAEVTQAVGLSVIGAVPILPKRVMRRLNGTSEADKYWRSMLSESVDSIAAVLLKGTQPGTTRVIMVSSANAGEGKTTLAAHLAVSLAGAGRHPVLVDFDLRRPALHRVFGVSLNPGVNEILRDGQDLESCLQATQVPNLMFLSAGRWSKTGLAGLVAADLQTLFSQLRAGFDFVIVDACPILPVVDTRLIGQHVDAVLLSVLRDVSRAPKLRAACDLLDMFGIPVIGVVVTGSSEELYKDSRYEPLSEAQAV